MPSLKCLLPSKRSVPRRFLLLISGLAFIFLVLLGYYLQLEGRLSFPSVFAELISFLSPTDDPPIRPPDVVMPLTDARSSQQFSFPGIRQPPTRSANEAGLAEDAEVIGVRIGGKARAYSVEALSRGPQSHVVNDLLGERPVTVAYCNVMGCARVFTADSSGAPLDLGVGGWQGVKGLIVRLDGVNYTLADGENLTNPKGSPLPFERMVYQRTTWGEWHQAHPETDVYVDPPDPSLQGDSKTE